MEKRCILFFISLPVCISDWILLPSLSPTKVQEENEFPSMKSPLRNTSHETKDFCPDVHNLTTMSYGSLHKEEIKSRTGWEISMEDVQEILKESENLPKLPYEKANLVKQMGENLMAAAEERIKSLFSTKRDARTKYFHGPKMESALMTIAILLFAVHLSKLIIKLLVSHYNRYNGGITMMTGIRAPIALTHGRRRRRSIQDEEIKIMQILDKYNTRFN